MRSGPDLLGAARTLARTKRQLIQTGSQPEYLPYLEPALLVRDMDSMPRPIVLEGAFARYVAGWVLYPTLDATAHALHCLRLTGALDEWSKANEGRARLYLSRCLRSQGFSIAAEELTPSLYATVNALNVIKALVGLDERTALVRERGKHRESTRALFGETWLATVQERILALLQHCRRDGGFVDAFDDSRSTAHAWYFALSILWNLGLLDDKARFGFTEESTRTFLSRCRQSVNGNGAYGFVAYEPRYPSNRKPCTTTTAMVVLGYDRIGWELPFDVPSIVRFLMTMQEEGGFRVFPGEPVTLSATAFSVLALDKLKALHEISDAEGVRTFVQSCRRPDGGYAFATDPNFSSNAYCTRQALRTLEHLDPCRRDNIPAPEREALAGFTRSLYAARDGSFWGYRGLREVDALNGRSSNTVREGGEPLAAEIARFQTELPRLLGSAENRFALIRGDALSVHETEREAVLSGLQQYKGAPFLVRRIARAERPARLSSPRTSRAD